MINVQGLRRNVKNVVKNYSEAQVKVREATSNDPWGPSGTLMGEIADLTYNVVAFSEIMQVRIGFLISIKYVKRSSRKYQYTLWDDVQCFAYLEANSLGFLLSALIMSFPKLSDLTHDISI